VQQAWTFEVQTADTWTKTLFGVWEVGINTDGNLNGPCGGSNFIAEVRQISTPAGAASNTFTASVGQPDSGCNPIVPSGQKPPAFTMTGNSVSLTFPASDMGKPAPTSLVWNGIIQSFAEEQSQTCTSPCGDVVPSATSLDSFLIQGAVADSVTPSAPGPPPSTCNTAMSGPEVATVSNPGQTAATNSAEAAAILEGAGGAFTDVRDYGEGVVSFLGDPTAAQTLLVAPPAPFTPLSASIGPGQTFTPLATVTNPNDPSYRSGSQWNLATIGAPGAWAVTNGNSVTVADIDTGVDYSQPDLGPNLLSGWDESTSTALPSGVVDVGAVMSAASGNTDTGQGAAGHGTAVAGTIAAVTNNSIGLASLGFLSKVLPVKVNFDDTTHISAEIASSIRWAADNGAKVLNLSFGTPCPDSNLALAVNYAQSKGLLVVAAAGDGALNSNLDTTDGTNNAPSYPAAYSTTAGPGAPVIAVGATGHDGLRAAYSNTGGYVSMMAPGGSNDGNPADDLPVLATRDTCPAPPCYTTANGTSLAAAQASAAAALIWSVNSTLTASQVGELVKSTTSDLGVSGTDVEYGTGMLNASVALADTPSPTAGYGTFVSLPPARILDTRVPIGAPKVPVGPGGTLPLTVTGVGGIPSGGVTAVVLNVTVISTAPGFLTVWPAGQTRPNASNINFGTNETIPNLVTVRVGANNQVDFFNSAGFVNVLADVAGYYTDGTTTGSTFVAVPPTRLLDTRSTGGPILAGTLNSRLLPITGGLVPNDATAVVVNVTVIGPTAPGFLTVYPANLSTQPLSSNLNFSAKETIPNLVSVQLGAVGTGPIEGINLFNSAGSVQAVVDLEGYFTCAPSLTCPQSRYAAGSRFFPLVAHRILDTRINIGGFSSPIGNAQSIVTQIVGQGGVLDTAAGVVMNTTVTQSTVGGYLTVYPSDLSSVPKSSNLNFTPAETIANLVTAKVPTTGAATGKDSFFNDAGTVQAIADVAGWYGAAGS
jgi:subtilisin family serine protease